MEIAWILHGNLSSYLETIAANICDHLSYFNELNPHNNPLRHIIISILQMKKPSFVYRQCIGSIWTQTLWLKSLNFAEYVRS